MQPRTAAFRLLRRIALADLTPSARLAAPFFPKHSARAFNTSRCLRDVGKFAVPKPPTALPRKAITKPTYELTFTCKPCSVRSTHEVSKQGYHHGSVLISCPGCKNRHVISDHLKIFGETPTSLEDLIKEKGQLIKKGTLSEDGNFEVWADGSATERKAGAGEETPPAWQVAEQKVLERMMQKEEIRKVAREESQ